MKLAIIILLFSTSSFAQTLVSSIQEANNAIQVAQPGAIIILKNGIYSGHINFGANGSANAPITLQAQTPNGVVLTGTSWVKITGQYLILKDIVFNKAQNPNHPGEPSNILVYFDQSSNCRITNCVFYKCGNPWDNNGTIVFLANGSAYNKVDHCFFTRSHSISAKVEVNDTQGANNHHNVIEYNYFKDIIDLPLNGDPAFNGCEPIAIGTGEGGHQNVFTTIQYNLFENTIVDSEIISNKSSNNTIQYNTLRGNYKQTNDGNLKPHLSIRGGDSCKIKGNFILDTHFGIVLHGNGHTVINNYIHGSEIGFRIRGGNSGYSNLLNSTIANNTIVNSTDQSIQFGEFEQHPQGNKLYNNIIYSDFSNSYKVQGITDAANLNDWKNNITYGDAQSGNITNSGIIDSNPSLVQQGGLYKLQSSSTAINMGYPITGIIEDMDGQTRIDNLDIGADEYSTSLIVRQPLQPSDVGPSWINSYSTFVIGDLDPTVMGEKVVQGDFDNDCRDDDIAVIYDYNGQTAIHLFSSSGTKFNYNSFWWDFPTGSGSPIAWFNFNNIKHAVSGDYDSDGFKDDIAFFHNENGNAAIHVVLSDGSKFIYDSFWWADPPGTDNPISWFNLNNIKYITTGDYDSDGKLDDIAVIYDEYGNTAIHVLLCNWNASLGRNDFEYDSFWWADPAGSDNPITWFNWNNIKNVTSGDYDGDGKIDDIAVIHDEYGNTAIHILLCKWNAPLGRNDFEYDSFWWADPAGSDNPITWFNLSNIKNVSSGDYDNDGKTDDLAVIYNEDGAAAIHMLKNSWNTALSRNDFYYGSFWWDFSTYEDEYRCLNCCDSNASRINEGSETEMITGVADVESERMYVYPNPATKVFLITGTNLSDCDFQLFDLTGRLIELKILKENDFKFKIDCINIESGTYILNVISDKKNYYKRIIIKE